MPLIMYVHDIIQEYLFVPAVKCYKPFNRLDEINKILKTCSYYFLTHNLFSLS